MFGFGIIIHLFQQLMRRKKSSSPLRGGNRRSLLSREADDDLGDVVVIPDWLPEHLRPKATDKELDKTD
jgi:hypothetical protein